MQHLGNTKIVPDLSVDLPWEWKLMVQSVTTSCMLSFCSLFHQHVVFWAKFFPSFQVSFSSFLLASPGPASSSVPVGGGFPIPLIPWAPLFFCFFGSPCFQPLSVLFLGFQLCPSPFIFLPYLFFPFSSPQAPLIFSRAVLFLLTCILYLPFSAPLLSDALFLRRYSKLTHPSFFPLIHSF